MVRHTFNDKGSIKLNVQRLNMRLNNPVNRIQWNSVVVLPQIKSFYVRYYATLVIKFVLHHRFSAIVVENHSSKKQCKEK